MMHHVCGIRKASPEQREIEQPNLLTKAKWDQMHIISDLHQVFHHLAEIKEEDNNLHDIRYPILLHEFNNLPPPSHHVRMIQEQREVYNFISHVPWEVDLFAMTQKFYHEQRDWHFAASWRLLTYSIIQKEPCQPIDEEIKIYLHHTTTSATAFEWLVHILNSTHIPHQQRWLIYDNPLEHYFRGLYPYCHAIMPTIVNYDYLHKLISHSYISNPINQFVFDNYGPTPKKLDTIEL